jgi:hypothetical protein
MVCSLLLLQVHDGPGRLLRFVGLRQRSGIGSSPSRVPDHKQRRSSSITFSTKNQDKCFLEQTNALLLIFLFRKILRKLFSEYGLL